MKAYPLFVAERSRGTGPRATDSGHLFHRRTMGQDQAILLYRGGALNVRGGQAPALRNNGYSSP